MSTTEGRTHRIEIQMRRHGSFAVDEWLDGGWVERYHASATGQAYTGTWDAGQRGRVRERDGAHGQTREFTVNEFGDVVWEV